MSNKSLFCSKKKSTFCNSGHREFVTEFVLVKAMWIFLTQVCVIIVMASRISTGQWTDMVFNPAEWRLAEAASKILEFHHEGHQGLGGREREVPHLELGVFRIA